MAEVDPTALKARELQLLLKYGALTPSQDEDVQAVLTALCHALNNSDDENGILRLLGAVARNYNNQE